MNELQSSKNHLIRSRSSLYHVQPGEYYGGGDEIDDASGCDDDHNSNDVFVGITVAVIINCFFSSGEEQVERPWQARKVPDRVGERHKSGVQVDHPKERQVGMDPVQDDDYRC